MLVWMEENGGKGKDLDGWRSPCLDSKKKERDMEELRPFIFLTSKSVHKRKDLEGK